MLQNVDLALRFDAAQVAEDGGGVFDVEARADRGEFAGKLLLPAILHSVGARGKNHVELQFLLRRVLDRFGELRGPCRGRWGRGRFATATGAAASASGGHGLGEHGAGARNQRAKKAVE